MTIPKGRYAHAVAIAMSYDPQTKRYTASLTLPCGWFCEAVSRSYIGVGTRLWEKYYRAHKPEQTAL